MLHVLIATDTRLLARFTDGSRADVTNVIHALWSLAEQGGHAEHGDRVHVGVVETIGAPPEFWEDGVPVALHDALSRLSAGVAVMLEEGLREESRVPHGA